MAEKITEVAFRYMGEYPRIISEDIDPLMRISTVLIVRMLLVIRFNCESHIKF